jgi:hypothetical protein
MVTSRESSSYRGAAPADRQQKQPALANCGPMTQQDAMGAHGYEMHPQGFVRLIGVHEADRQKKEDATRRLHT